MRAIDASITMSSDVKIMSCLYVCRVEKEEVGPSSVFWVKDASWMWRTIKSVAGVG